MPWSKAVLMVTVVGILVASPVAGQASSQAPVTIGTDAEGDPCAFTEPTVCSAAPAIPGEGAVDILGITVANPTADAVQVVLHLADVAAGADAVALPNPDLLCQVVFDGPAGPIWVAFDYKTSWIADYAYIAQMGASPFVGTLNEKTRAVLAVDESANTLAATMPRAFLGATADGATLSRFTSFCGTGGYEGNDNGATSAFQAPMSDEAPAGAVQSGARFPTPYVFPTLGGSTPPTPPTTAPTSPGPGPSPPTSAPPGTTPTPTTSVPDTSGHPYVPPPTIGVPTDETSSQSKKSPDLSLVVLVLALGTVVVALRRRL